MTLETYPKEEI